MFDATQIQIREETKQAKEKVAGFLEQVNDLEDRTGALFQLYNFLYLFSCFELAFSLIFALTFSRPMSNYWPPDD